MINISEKYRHLIKQMLEDAEVNLKEAEQNLEKASRYYERCKKDFDNLTECTRLSLQEFPDMAKQLKRFSKTSDPNLETLSEIVTICQAYIDASQEMPTVERNLNSAEKAYSRALEKKMSASNIIESINCL